jgi:hypothetical protein
MWRTGLSASVSVPQAGLPATEQGKPHDQDKRPPPHLIDQPPSHHLRRAAAGLVGTLLAITLGSASAMPGRGDPPAAPAPAVITHGHYVAHGCFITPHTWSVELAGPLPVCYTYVP